MEQQFVAHNCRPIPVVFSRASGSTVWDPEGRQYLDFLSGHSAVNQGHCHPELVQALLTQACTLTLSSRAFYNDVLPRFARYVTKLFGFDMVLPMNTGTEAVETAIKVARQWGYKVKGIPMDKALVLGVAGNFHGRTSGAVSLSSDLHARNGYGPHLPGVSCMIPGTTRPIPFNDKAALREAFETAGPCIAAFIVEPIQGEAGVIVPDDDYLPEVRALCDKHNVLLVCDEIQTGVGRTGKLLCYEWSNIKPDVVLLGKALSGGMYPVSCVLGSKDVMLTVDPGTHGSTFGGNPLGCAVSIRALELVQEEGLIDRSERLGQIFRHGLQRIDSPLFKTVRGKGLLNAIVMEHTTNRAQTAWELCMLLKDKGLLAKPTRQNVVRLAPPLVITDEQLHTAIQIITEAINDLARGSPKTRVLGIGARDD